MGVDSFWKRVPSETIDDTAPEEWAGHVPHWFDDGFAAQRDAGLIVGAEDTGALIEAVIGMGAYGTRWETAARTFCAEPVDWDDDWMVGTIDPDTVALVAEVLTAASAGGWTAQHHLELVEYAKELGYHRPFDDNWAQQVAADLGDLAALFRAATAAREAVIHKIIA